MKLSHVEALWGFASQQRPSFCKSFDPEGTYTRLHEIVSSVREDSMVPMGRVGRGASYLNSHSPLSACGKD